MPAQPEDHWGKLANEFGVEVTPLEPDADAEQGTTSDAVESPPVAPIPAQNRVPEKPKLDAPPKKSVPRPAAHWDSVAGDLGLDVPQREAEAEMEVESQEPEFSTAPVVAEKSPLDELFVPRDNIDEDVVELFESVEVEVARTDASYFDITDSAAADVEDSIEVIVEELEEEVGIQPRRRRRRSRSRRSSPLSDSVIESQPESVTELEIEAEPAEEILDPLAPAAEEFGELAPVDPDAEGFVKLKPADEDRPRPRRRSRRRRRSKGSESADRENQKGRAADLPTASIAGPKAEELASGGLDADDLDADDLDADDLDSDDLDSDDMQDQDETSSRGRRSKSKKITGWIEAVSVMVDANIERHKKGDSDRSRGGRSRGRRGR